MEVDMEEKHCLKNCREDDVLSFGNTMFKVDKLKQEVQKLFEERKLGEQLSKSFASQNLNVQLRTHSSTKNYYFYEDWFSDGINCEILRVGQAWQKGKVKINLKVSLEFCSDDLEIEETSISEQKQITQPESSLDDIRRMINQES